MSSSSVVGIRRSLPPSAVANEFHLCPAQSGVLLHRPLAAAAGLSYAPEVRLLPPPLTPGPHHSRLPSLDLPLLSLPLFPGEFPVYSLAIPWHSALSSSRSYRHGHLFHHFFG